MIKLAPSILSADFSVLGEEVKMIEKAGADLIHIDVMDGHFVPNISYGSTVMKSLLGKTKLPFDVHLMIENPDLYLEDFVTENTEFIVVHQEATIHLNRTIQHIKNLGVKAGVALNPSTPISTLEHIIEDLDLVLIMSVNPGFSGQKFIPSAIGKVEQLSKLRIDRKLSFDIQVDGGVCLDNAKELVFAGANILVAGSEVFKSPDPTTWIKNFKELFC